MSEFKYIVSFIIVLFILAMRDVMLEYDFAHNVLNDRFSPNICVPSVFLNIEHIMKMSALY